MGLSPQRLDCCEQGRWAITQRESDPFQGPQEAGWAMVANLLIGTPEYANVIVCPFCGTKIVNKEDQK